MSAHSSVTKKLSHSALPQAWPNAVVRFAHVSVRVAQRTRRIGTPPPPHVRLDGHWRTPRLG